MSHRNDLLMLVRQQLDANLSQLSDAAVKHAATPNNAVLAPCVMVAHQVSGALSMVQLPGAARFGSEIETALKTALRATPADAGEVSAAGRAAGTLREFVNDLANGGAYVPLRLFPAYRDLARVSGNSAASEKDLFFPDAGIDTPPHVNPRPITPAVLPALVKDLRSRYQRGLLAWLKESTKPDGPAQMRQVLDQLYQIAAQLPEPRGLWWAATVLMDGVIELLPDAQAAEWITRVKPACSRVDFLLRDLAANAKVNAAPAQRDVYYAIASCHVPTPRLREAQRLLRLDDLIPDDRSIAGEWQRLQPLLDDARTRIENVKDVWTEYSSGEPNRLGRFRELLAPLTQKARDLGNVPLLHLLLAANNATAQLPDPYPLDGQVMSLEMASALLMAESIVTHFHDLPADLEQQVQIMKGWLADAAAGKIGTSSPAGLRADIVQKANDEKLRIATAREILKNLQQVERAVEAYATDPGKRETLPPLAGTLRQVEGVFDISNQRRAARLALACRRLIERCAQAPAGEAKRDIEWLAEGLGCLGFYLDPCLHGKEPNERAINLYFTRYEKQEGLEALLALSQQIAVPKLGAAVAESPAPAPATPGVDPEMLEVFLEEANEVLAAMETSLAQARSGSGDHDALINMRRGFHTLKGSSRMVGLSAYGDCAWEMEQVMNQWLAQARGAEPELLDLCNDARELLAEWAHDLRGDAAPVIDTTGIVRRARALRGEPLPAAPAPTPVVPAVPVAPAPTEAATTLVRVPSAVRPALPMQYLDTVVVSTTGKMHTDAAPAAQNLAATATVVIESTPPVSAQTARIITAPRPAAAPAPALPYEQTLSDLGDRLLWIGGLSEEIQDLAKGAANPRLADAVANLHDSIGETRELHRKLQALLAAAPRQ